MTDVALPSATPPQRGSLAFGDICLPGVAPDVQSKINKAGKHLTGSRNSHQQAEELSMKTLKLTLAAAALGALVTLPVTSAHAWGGWGPGYGYGPYDYGAPYGYGTPCGAPLPLLLHAAPAASQ